MFKQIALLEAEGSDSKKKKKKIRMNESFILPVLEL